MAEEFDEFFKKKSKKHYENTDNDLVDFGDDE